VCGLRFTIYGPGFEVRGVGSFRIWGLGLGLGAWSLSLGLRAPGVWFGVWELGFRV